MTQQEFHDRAIEWLRAEKNLRTETIVGVRLEGKPRIEGYFPKGNAATRWAMIGLWVVTIGIIVGMVNMPGFTAATAKAFESAGYAVVAAGFGCWVIAEIARRRDRTRAIVDLRAVTSEPLTPELVAALQEDARGGVAWIVAEAPLDEAARTAASKRGIACFVLEGERFRELGAPA